MQPPHSPSPYTGVTIYGKNVSDELATADDDDEVDNLSDVSSSPNSKSKLNIERIAQMTTLM